MLKNTSILHSIDRSIAKALLDKDVAPARLYRARIAVLLALAVVVLSVMRAALYDFGSLPMLLCLLTAIAGAATIGAYRCFATFELTSFIFLLVILTIESSLAIASHSVFSTFYSWLPLSIAFCCFFSGLKWGGLYTILAFSEAMLVIHATKGYGPQANIYAEPHTFLLSWQLHFLLVELFGAMTLFAFSKVRDKGEHELQSRQIMRAKATRKAALADVVGSLAHELNNPLAIIHGSMLRYQHELEKSSMESGLRHYLWECMDDALVRIEVVASGLKTFASGDVNEPMRLIALQKLIQSSERQAKERIRASGATLTIENPRSNLNLMCRPQQIIFVLASLLENAAETVKDQSSNPQIRLVIRPTNSQLRIEIIDNGPGLDHDEAERIFQPFATRGAGETSSMGLSICRGIVEEHGGRIGFVRDGDETHFWFELPLDDKDLS